MKMQRKLLAAVILALLIAPAASQQIPFRADSQINVKSVVVSNNVSPTVVSTVRSTLYSIDAFNNSTTLAYIKLYNASSATCGSGTPFARYMIPFGTSSSGGGFAIPNINGDAYVNGITMCVTTGIADSDTGAPAASTYIVNLHYDTQGP
jgi:hypothetical protein